MSTEQKLDRIIELLEQLVGNTPTPVKKPRKQKPAPMGPKEFHIALERELGTNVAYSSGQQFGLLGKHLRKLTDHPEATGFVRYIATDASGWYRERGVAITLTVVNKNFTRWLEQYRSTPITETVQEELKIK